LCLLLTERDCLAKDGIYLGDGTGCEPDPCVPQIGACCFPGKVCFELTAPDCAVNGGVYQGDGSTCAQPCPPTSNCCFAHPTPGCDDPQCEAAVCAIQSFCCDFEWDAFCAQLALNFCPGLCGSALNDQHDRATTITGEGLFGFDNSAATTDGPPAPGCMIEDDVWFRWTAPCSGMVRITTCGLSGVDTSIAAYHAAAQASLDSPGVLLACNDDACGLQSRVELRAEAGSTYLIRIGTPQGASGGTGQFQIHCNGP
jgi:hypothetical protein